MSRVVSGSHTGNSQFFSKQSRILQNMWLPFECSTVIARQLLCGLLEWFTKTQSKRRPIHNHEYWDTTEIPTMLSKKNGNMNEMWDDDSTIKNYGMKRKNHMRIAKNLEIVCSVCGERKTQILCGERKADDGKKKRGSRVCCLCLAWSGLNVENMKNLGDLTRHNTHNVNV